MSIPSRIQFLDPEGLGEFLKSHSGDEASASALADGILRLLMLHCSYIKSPTPTVGSILQPHYSGTELDWTIIRNPEPSGFKGQHVLTGGLVRHEDGRWGIHT